MFCAHAGSRWRTACRMAVRGPMRACTWGAFCAFGAGGEERAGTAESARKGAEGGTDLVANPVLLTVGAERGGIDQLLGGHGLVRGDGERGGTSLANVHNIGKEQTEREREALTDPERDRVQETREETQKEGKGDRSGSEITDQFFSNSSSMLEDRIRKREQKGWARKIARTRRSRKETIGEERRGSCVGMQACLNPERKKERGRREKTKGKERRRSSSIISLLLVIIIIFFFTLFSPFMIIGIEKAGKENEKQCHREEKRTKKTKE